MSPATATSIDLEELARLRRIEGWVRGLLKDDWVDSEIWDAIQGEARALLEPTQTRATTAPGPSPHAVVERLREENETIRKGMNAVAEELVRLRRIEEAARQAVEQATQNGLVDVTALRAALEQDA